MLHPILVRTVAESLYLIFTENQYADKVIESALRNNPKAGSRDRAFIAETTYEIVRFFRKYTAVLGHEPRNVLDFWKIVGIYFFEKNGTLPDWSEFKSLKIKDLQQKLNELSQHRTLRESVPDWIDELAVNELGSNDWAAILTALNRPADVILRTNTLKTNRLELQNALHAAGIESKKLGDDRSDALQLVRRQNVFRSEPFKKGWFEVQDFSSQQVAPMLDVQPGQRVVDACAGAGGKTLHLASLLQNRGSIIALDNLQWKLDELKLRARRAGASNIQTRFIENSKTIKRLHGTADRLLLDVPCSGLGVLRRNPDSKWKLLPDFLEKIKATQREILENYALICKPGGKMVYATCSILPSENRQQVDYFLDTPVGKHFKFVSERELMPHTFGFDGFYMALLERI